MTIQFIGRPGIVDLGWGHPDPESLPVTQWAAANASALGRYGWAALTYGAGPGPAPLVDWLCARMAETDGRRPDPAEVFVTGGASQGLELVTSVLTQPGDTVLVDTPTYHLALRVLADHRIHLVAAPVDDIGMLPAATEELIGRLGRVAFVYLVPTFSNPTGASLPADRRRALVGVGARTGVPVVEDDTYRELSYAGPAPDSLWSLDGDAVIRLGSFSKSVAPGLRLGWITAAAPFVRRLADRGFVDSGGGVNHAVALAMAEFGSSGAYARHVDAIRDRYRERRDALAGAVRRHVEAAEFTVPDGGWFLWARLPSTVDTEVLLDRAERAGVAYLPGARFYVDPPSTVDFLRLSFSMLGTAELIEGARRLGRALAERQPAG
jgi:DNA-binding transcriptional MocR family regulator